LTPGGFSRFDDIESEELIGGERPMQDSRNDGSDHRVLMTFCERR
jgi:hypothetical protein